MVFLIEFSSNASAQNEEIDQEMLAKHFDDLAEKKHKHTRKANVLTLPLHLLLDFYQKVVSPQISAQCLYEVSCSRHSRLLIQRFGPLKGVFLSADRLSRCNMQVAEQVSPARISQKGKIKDEIVWYAKD